MTPDQLRELAAKKAGERFKIEPNTWGIIPCGNDYKLQNRKAFIEGASLFLEPLAVAMEALEMLADNETLKGNQPSGASDIYEDFESRSRIAAEASAKIAAKLEKP